MTQEKVVRAGETVSVNGSTVFVRVDTSPENSGKRWLRRTVLGLLLVSIILNLWFILDPLSYSPPGIPEQHFAGDSGAKDRIAIINFEGTISPPFTERWLKQIKRATEDETVKGVVMVIDSPGGFVADSHQLLRKIQELAKSKPVYVSMKRIAASGGYYISMGIGEQGRIFAEPTTWTGSIGVIIPRYNATELVEKIGVKSEPLVTGPLKDTLNPFRDMTEQETQVWDAILKDSFDRFVSVIDAGRAQLDDAVIRKLATGQIYTANQALENSLVDEIGYTEDAVAALAKQLQLSSYDAFEYRSTPGLVDALIGSKASAADVIADQILQASVPRAMYYASWNPWVPVQ
jgi:protease-4